MFTGIVETQGEVLSNRAGGFLVVRSLKQWKDLQPGESIAVDGVCLTVDRIQNSSLSFRLLPETTRATSLGRLRKGSRVNLERSLRFGGRLGGHLLLGHVDGQGTVVGQLKRGGSRMLEVELPSRLRRLLVPKGPIALDGVSLTLGPALGRNTVRVHLVPFTLSVTSLGAKRLGDKLNVELDLVAKYLWGVL